MHEEKIIKYDKCQINALKITKMINASDMQVHKTRNQSSYYLGELGEPDLGVTNIEDSVSVLEEDISNNPEALASVLSSDSTNAVRATR